MGDGTALRGVQMTLNTHRRGPVRVLDAPDGHDVIIEGRLDVHTVPDIRDAIHAVINQGPGELRLHLGGAEIGDATGPRGHRPPAPAGHPRRAPAAPRRRERPHDAPAARLPSRAHPRPAPRRRPASRDCGASHRLSACPPPRPRRYRRAMSSTESTPHPRRPGDARPSVGHAHVCRPLECRCEQRALPPQPRQGPDRACPSPSTCRPRPATTPTTSLARGEVGKVGVPISHIGDMAALFADIPLREMNTSMTINATAMWLLALYQVAAERQAEAAGEDPADWVHALAGTTQNDIIKEYLSRGTYVFPPAPSLRLITDMVDLHGARDPEVEPDQHLQLPPAGGRGDARAGDRLRDVDGGRRARRRARLGAGAARGVRRASSPGSPSSSTPACASSRRCARCAPSCSCGTS